MCTRDEAVSPSQEVLDEHAEVLGRYRLLRVDLVAADLMLVREDTVKEKRDQGRPFEPLAHMGQSAIDERERVTGPSAKSARAHVGNTRS